VVFDCKKGVLFCRKSKINQLPERIKRQLVLLHSARADVEINTKAVSTVTGLEWPRGFQEVKVPRFHDNGTGWW
jgi:hypothetical protein